MSAEYKLQTYKDVKGKFRWRLKSKRNGQIVATDGGQGYSRETDLWRVIRNIAQALDSANDGVETEEPPPTPDRKE